MRQCRFCGRWFKNQQSVRSHLKWCNDYREGNLRTDGPPFEKSGFQRNFFSSLQSPDRPDTHQRVEEECIECGYREPRTTFGRCRNCGSRKYWPIYSGPPWLYCHHCGSPSHGNNPDYQCPCGGNKWWDEYWKKKLWYEVIGKECIVCHEFHSDTAVESCCEKESLGLPFLQIADQGPATRLLKDSILPRRKG